MNALADFSIDSTTMALIFGGVLLLNIILLIFTVILFIRLSKIFKSSTGKDLESVLQTLVAHKKDAERVHAEVAATLIQHNERLTEKARAPHVHRFNAFDGTGEGGKQSFATALVSEQGDGMVLSSIYMRDKMRIYAKPVEAYTSTFELTEEEKSVLAKAKK